METMLPKVEFVLGSEVSPSHFFKSSYARSVAETSARDSKSLDYDFLDNGTITEESGGGSGTNDGNNNFYSLVNFGSESGGGAAQPSSAIWSSAVQQVRSVDVFFSVLRGLSTVTNRWKKLSFFSVVNVDYRIYCVVYSVGLVTLR